LKEASIVRESRIMKRTYVGPGSGRGAVVPKRRVNFVSFQIPKERFAREVAANLEVPCVVDVIGVDRIVEETVSTVLAAMYVPE
jgi:hypothetical protein